MATPRCVELCQQEIVLFDFRVEITVRQHENIAAGDQRGQTEQKCGKENRLHRRDVFCLVKESEVSAKNASWSRTRRGDAQTWTDVIGARLVANEKAKAMQELLVEMQLSLLRKSSIGSLCLDTEDGGSTNARDWLFERRNVTDCSGPSVALLINV